MKNKNVDKGFEIWFDNLSYRRKFIRNTWLFFCFVAIMWLTSRYLDMDETREKLIWIMILTVIPVQSIYYYRKWRKEIQQDN